MPALDRALTIEDLRVLARRRVPKQFYEYVDAGAFTAGTYAANEADYRKIAFRQRVAVSLENRNLASTLLGQPVCLPLAISPVGSTGMTDADGEIKAARAAEKLGIPFTLSTMSICSIEDVAAHTTKPFWFQLYVVHDRTYAERLIDRAKAAKCSALFVTVDAQIPVSRHTDVRNGLSTPPRITARFVAEMLRKPGWALRMLGTNRHFFGNVYGHAPGVTSLKSLGAWVVRELDPALSWDDVAWIKQRFGGPVVVKGILEPEDAIAAIEHGADAIVVSNHGGRQLDGAPSTIRALPRIVDAVGHRTEVLIDGGIRSGQDLLKALALGAKGGMIGRAMAYGLGAGGEAGVSRALEIIRKEADISMALMGERDIRNIGPHNIYANDLARM